jgi:hypothetical protein
MPPDSPAAGDFLAGSIRPDSYAFVFITILEKTSLRLAAPDYLLDLRYNLEQ